MQDIEIPKLFSSCIERAILGQFGSSYCMKIKKTHNFSDYNLNDLGMTLKVIGKMSNNYFSEVYFLRSTNPCSNIN